MADSDGRDLKRLRDDFPTWTIWRNHDAEGTPGEWWATCNHVLNGAEMCAGLAHSLAAPTAAKLREALERQAGIEAQVEAAKLRAAAYL